MDAIEWGSRIGELIDRGDYSSALPVARDALKQHPDDHEIELWIGIIHHLRQHYKRAAHATRKALERRPRCPMAMSMMADHVGMLDDLDQAIAIHRKIMRLGVRSLDNQCCFRSRRAMQSVVNDSRLSLASLYRHKRNSRRAKYYFREYQRGKKGLSSWFPREHVRRIENEIGEL